MKHAIIGTAGHVDHGKTCLIRALTGMETDRLKEEKKRGITIENGFADMIYGDYNISIIDVPGHERFIKNMLAGIGGIDIVLLVIGLDEGVMPQTVEHFQILKNLLWAGCPDKHTGYDSVAENPFQCHLRQTFTTLFCDFIQRLNLMNLTVRKLLFFQETTIGIDTAVCRNTIQITVCQHALCQRTECNDSLALFLRCLL